MIGAIFTTSNTILEGCKSFKCSMICSKNEKGTTTSHITLSLTCLTNSHLEAMRVDCHFLNSLSSFGSQLKLIL